MKTNREQISLWQLFCLIETFVYGSVVIVSPGKEAGGAQFLVTLVGIPIAIGAIWFFHFLVSKHPQHDLFALLQFLFGRSVSKLLIFLYVLYFFYLASRVLRDFVEMVNTVILPTTPMTVISLTMMVVIIYILSLGLEVIGRLGEIFMPIMTVVFLVVVLLLAFSGQVKVKNIQPILGEGFLPIWKSIFPGGITFPIGELILFTLLFTSVSNFKSIRKVGVYVSVMTGVMLSLLGFTISSALGVDALRRSDFPLLNAARLISIGNFIERTDALVLFIVMLGVVIKVGLFFYAGLKGVQAVFQRPYQQFVLPMGCLISVWSVLIASSYAEHITEGLEVVTKYVHLPMQYGFPVVFLLVALVKTRKKGQLQEEGEPS